MKTYFYDGLLPDKYLNEAFEMFFGYEHGLIENVFEQIGREISKKHYKEIATDYLWELEGHINEVVRNKSYSNYDYFDFETVVKMAIKYYLIEMLETNSTELIANKAEIYLVEYGFAPEDIYCLNTYSLTAHVTVQHTISNIREACKALK